MVTIRDILKDKGCAVRTIPDTSTVLEATQLMNEHLIGALVVTASDGRMAGIFTERDVLRRIVAVERMPSEVRVGDVMTNEICCCRPDTSLEEARGVMKHRRIRHLPVVSEEGELHGLVSIGDLNAHQATDHECTIHYLHEYLYGRV